MLSENKKTITILIGWMIIIFSILYFCANHLNQSSGLADIVCLILFISGIGIIKLNPQAMIVVMAAFFLLACSFVYDAIDWARIIYFTDQIKFFPGANKFGYFLESIKIDLWMLGILIFVILFLGGVVLDKKK